MLVAVSMKISPTDCNSFLANIDIILAGLSTWFIYNNLSKETRLQLFIVQVAASMQISLPLKKNCLVSYNYTSTFFILFMFMIRMEKFKFLKGLITIME